MEWVQVGAIFNTDGSRNWSRSHAQVPTALPLGERIRVYYATRDGLGRSRTTFVEVKESAPGKVVYEHPHPVIELGEAGCHDEDGVMVSSLLQNGEDVWMYYTAWSKGGGSVPYRVSCGLAISQDGGLTFDRAFPGPVVDRTRFEPFLTMTPYVIRQPERWTMWYGSGLRWLNVAGKMEPLYAIKYAESSDGLAWNQPNILCIRPLHPLEANCRASVVRSCEGYEMWFSYRHAEDFRGGVGSYRIGYAISRDGVEWERLEDPKGLEPGAAAWSSTMMAYPSVVEACGKQIMFHNGNEFGRSGFGYAERIG